jgi:hypothetical protein
MQVREYTPYSKVLRKEDPNMLTLQYLMQRLLELLESITKLGCFPESSSELPKEFPTAFPPSNCITYGVRYCTYFQYGVY